MTRLEQIEFENYEKLTAAIENIVEKKDAFRTYKNKEGQDVTKKIISNNRLYVGNNYSLSINKADNGKIYLAIEYFSADDRIRIAANATETINL